MMPRMHAIGAIASQRVILFNLLGRQNLPLINMRAQMHRPKPSLQIRDFIKQTGHARFIDRALGKQTVKLALFVNDAATNVRRTVFYLRDQRLGSLTLLIGQVQFICQFKNMARTGEGIKLGGPCKAHAPALQIILHLLL